MSHCPSHRPQCTIAISNRKLFLFLQFHISIANFLLRKSFKEETIRIIVHWPPELFQSETKWLFQVGICIKQSVHEINFFLQIFFIFLFISELWARGQALFLFFSFISLFLVLSLFFLVLSLFWFVFFLILSFYFSSLLFLVFNFCVFSVLVQLVTTSFGVSALHCNCQVDRMASYWMKVPQNLRAPMVPIDKGRKSKKEYVFKANTRHWFLRIYTSISKHF